MNRTRKVSDKEFLKEPGVITMFRKPKPQVPSCEQLNYFCSTTANHGFPHIVDDKEIFCFRITWAIVVACFASIFITLMVMSLITLLDKNLTTEIVNNVHGDHTNKGMMLPDIHICDASIFNADVLYEMGLDNATATYLTLATSLNSFPDYASNDTIDLTKQKFDSIMAKGNWTVRDVMHNASIKCKDIILICSKEGKFYSDSECCETFFANSTYVSIFGSCITTHGKNIQQNYASRDAGFTVYLTPNQNVLNFDLDIIKADYVLQKGLYYAVSSAAEDIASVLHTAGRFAAPNTWVSVPITKSVVDHSELKDNLLAPFPCIDTKDEDSIHKKAPRYDYYSESNCRMSAVQEAYNKYNCSAVFLKHGPFDQLCDPNVIMTVKPNSNTSNTNKFGPEWCPVECIAETFELSPSSAQSNIELLDLQVNTTYADDQPVVLHFFYSSFKYQVRKSHTESFTKWLGEIGGNFGLFLGGSLISILEIVALLLRCCIKSRPGRRI